MGYTHYFTFKSCSKEIEQKYQDALNDCRKIVVSFNNENTGDDALVIYDTQNGLHFGGAPGFDCESFDLQDPPKEGFNFCKTQRNPYDVAVTACLSVLKHHIGEAVKIGSDGERDEWEEGVQFAQEVLGRDIENPVNDND